MWEFSAAALALMWAVVILAFVNSASPRMRKGKWQTRRTATGLDRFDSDLGRFEFDHEGRLRIHAWHTPDRTIPLDQIRGLRFSCERRTSREAVEEFGVNRGSRQIASDVLDRYEVALITAQGPLPVFVAGQVFRELPLIGGFVTSVATALDRRGPVLDVEGFARNVVDELQQEFARRGRPLSLL